MRAFCLILAAGLVAPSLLQGSATRRVSPFSLASLTQGSPGAQKPEQAAPAAPPNTPAPQAPLPATGRYTYNPGDRRDPFVSLLGIGTEAGTGSNRIEGLGGMAVGEISVQGILQTRGIIISMVQGPDNKSYVVREGDKFLDGTVQSVTPEGLVIVQEVNDPLSLVKQRVIRKLLRSLEDVKQ